jgi:hypothetical protein
MRHRDPYLISIARTYNQVTATLYRPRRRLLTRKLSYVEAGNFIADKSFATNLDDTALKAAAMAVGRIPDTADYEVIET